MPGDITLLYSVSRRGALDLYQVIHIANSVFSFVIVTQIASNPSCAQTGLLAKSQRLRLESIFVGALIGE
jgi:hypothetical protein